MHEIVALAASTALVLSFLAVELLLVKPALAQVDATKPETVAT
jgi:hypothetical protein